MCQFLEARRLPGESLLAGRMETDLKERTVSRISKKGDERRKRTGIEQRFKFGFINIPTNNTDI